MNGYKVAQDYVPGWLSLLSTPLMTASMIYNVSKLSLGGFHSAFDLLESLVLRKPLPSLSFQLRPKTTAAMFLSGLMISTLSYATLYMLFYGSYKDEYPIKRELGIATITATDIYHLIGVMHLYNSLLRRFTKDPHEQFLFQLEKEVEALQKMPLEEFISFAESLTEEQRDLCDIQLPDEVDLSLRDLEKGSVVAEVVSPQPALKSHANSWFSKWWSAPTAPPVVQQQNEARHQRLLG